MRIAVIIPALNEAGNIRNLVAETRTQPVLGTEHSIIVVDNNSTDGTGTVAQQAGAQVIVEPRRGYGYACAAGVRTASEADVLVFLDGDYSSLPSELDRVLAPVLNDSADLVLGSRVRGDIEPGAMPLHQRFGNWLASRLMRILYRVEVTDLGPYRAIRADLLANLDMREMTYGWPTEMMVKAARRKARILEVPVSFCNRRSGQSKVSGTVKGSIMAAYYILGVTLRYAL